MLVGHDVATLVDFGDVGDETGCGNVAREHEDAEGLALVLGTPGLALLGLRVLQYGAAQSRVSRDAHDARVVADCDLRVLLGRLGSGGRAGEIVAAHKDGDVLGVLGEEYGLLRRGKAAAHHEHFLAGEELAIAGRAVRDAVALVVLLAIEADVARGGAACEQHRQRLDVALGRVHGLHVAVHLQAGDFGHLELGAKVRGLLAHRARKLLARGSQDAGVVDDLVRDGNLPAEAVLLEHEHAVAGAPEVKRRGEAGGASADDDGVVEILRVGHFNLLESVESLS